MSIRYINKNQSSAGQNQVQTREFATALIIGRAGKSDILVSDPNVALEHARIYIDNEHLKVEDLDSSIGLQVNGVFLKHASLQAGDIVKIAGHSFAIQKQNSIWIIESNLGQQKAISSIPIKHTAESLQIQNRFPRIRTISLLFVTMVLVYYFCIPLFSQNHEQYSSGTMSDSHAMLATNCQACHSQPFQSIPDSACTTCHTLTEHFPEKITPPHPEPRCVDCHLEHKGNQSLIIDSNMHCISCHASNTINREAKVISFDTHPDFQLAETDNSNTKVNHKLHLATDLRGPDGPVTLTCSSCHELDETGKRMRPITFEERCQECHSLGFDERLPDTQVPHKDPDVVFSFLYAEYAKLYLEDRSIPQTDPVQRQKPGGETPNQKAADRMRSTALAFAREQIESDARAAEFELFTAQACHVCHGVSRFDAVPEQSRKSQFSLLQPGINRHWFDKAQFDHKAHDEIACESCHAGIASSEQTGDLHLPELKDCVQCHSDSDAHSKIQTNCADCHSYHDSVPLEHERKRPIKAIVEQQ